MLHCPDNHVVDLDVPLFIHEASDVCHVRGDRSLPPELRFLSTEPDAARRADPAEPPPRLAIVFVIAGQSNADGSHAYADRLPPELCEAIPGAYAYRWATRDFAPLQAGVNTGYFTPQMQRWATRTNFGPEVMFAKLATQVLDADIYIVKLGLDAMPLAPMFTPAGVSGWHPALAPTPSFRPCDRQPCGEPLPHRFGLYADLVHDLAAAVRAIPGRKQFGGVLWQHGESDSADFPFFGSLPALTYEAHLRLLIASLRRDVRTLFGDDRFPFLIGKLPTHGATSPVPTWMPHSDIVEAAQERVALAEGGSWIVDTTGVARMPDGLHFSADGMLELGERYFATWGQAMQPQNWPPRDGPRAELVLVSDG